jgi:hypothetical protein
MQIASVSSARNPTHQFPLSSCSKCPMSICLNCEQNIGGGVPLVLLFPDEKLCNYKNAYERNLAARASLRSSEILYRQAAEHNRNSEIFDRIPQILADRINYSSEFILKTTNNTQNEDNICRKMPARKAASVLGSGLKEV